MINIKDQFLLTLISNQHSKGNIVVISDSNNIKEVVIEDICESKD